MKAHDHANCRKGCEVEFNLCVVHGPGYADCMQEFTDRQPGSPLTQACDEGCTPTTTMTAHNDDGKPNCEAACAFEFKICISEGPGLVACVYELRDQQNPLAAVCDRDCHITNDMQTYVAPSPPPFPPVHECSRSCAAEFFVCAQHADGATQADKCANCKSEMQSLPAESPLFAAGCSFNCQYTTGMAAVCP
jgi:hypothetical protein